MQRKVILLLGKTGSGKSTLAKKLLKGFPRSVTFDPLAEYRGGLIFTDLETFGEHIGPYAGTSDPFHFVCRFQGPDLETTEAMYHGAARILYVVGDVCLLLEEVEQYLSSYDGDNPINYLISFGRHKRVSLIGIGRRPSDLAIKLRAQCTTVVSFHQNEPRDIAYLETWGFDPGALESLGPFEYAYTGEDPDALLKEAAATPDGFGL
jgi:hypothetical protein